MQVNGNISDLFFNTDVSAAAQHDLNGKFTGWDHDKLCAEAQMFLDCLQRLGVDAPPIDDLIADFHKRV